MDTHMLCFPCSQLAYFVRLNLAAHARGCSGQPQGCRSILLYFLRLGPDQTDITLKAPICALDQPNLTLPSCTINAYCKTVDLHRETSCRRALAIGRYACFFSALLSINLASWSLTRAFRSYISGWSGSLILPRLSGAVVKTIGTSH